MKKILTFRSVIQAAVFGLLIFLSISHLKYGIEKAASIDAYCPYGAVESFFTKVITGSYLNRIWTSSFILMIITIIVTVIFGRIFCSYLCPLGALQEWIRNIGKKIGIKKNFELPFIIDKYARYLKYLVLILTAYYSYKLGDLFFRNYDPYNALMHFGSEYEEKMIAYIILGAVLVLALFSKNWWCRYLCPMGAFLAIIKKISPFKILRDTKTCVSCGSCNNVCPANLNVQEAIALKSADCISCLNCVNVCPERSLNAKISRWSVNKKIFGWLAIISFFIPLAIIIFTPLWQTKAPTNIINTQGEIDVANIRGSNTLKTVIENTNIPLEVFIKDLNLPKDVDTSLMLKEIGTKYNIKNKEGIILETQDFRDVISNKAQSK